MGISPRSEYRKRVKEFGTRAVERYCVEVMELGSDGVAADGLWKAWILGGLAATERLPPIDAIEGDRAQSVCAWAMRSFSLPWDSSDEERVMAFARQASEALRNRAPGDVACLYESALLDSCDPGDESLLDDPEFCRKLLRFAVLMATSLLDDWAIA